MMESAVNPGMCRCCASEGAFKDVKSTYHWMGEEEIYADMLRECFDIILNVSGQGEDGGICEVCITQLRNAINFKKQVLHTEEQFQKHLQNKTPFRPNIVKVEVQGDEDSDDNMASGDEGFSGAEFEVPIKTELDDPKPKKRGAKASATTTRASAKKAKADNGETSTKRKQQKVATPTQMKTQPNPAVPVSSKKVESSLLRKCKATLKKTILVKPDAAPRSRASRLLYKHLHNLKLILESSNATMIFKHGDKGYLCCYCTEGFDEPLELKLHTLTEHQNEEKFYGNLNAKGPSVLLVKLDITNLKCLLCSTDIDSLEDLLVHLTEKHKKNFHTDIKNQIFPFKFNNERHLKCCQCDDAVVYATFRALHEHMNKHYRYFVCTECDAGFVNSISLSRHSLTHTKGAYTCRHCPEVFENVFKRSSHELRSHSKTGYSSRCHFCSEGFREHIEKKQHLATVHGIATPTYECRACDKSFFTNSILRAHVRRVHLLEKKHQCSECDKAFFDSCDMKKHMLTHTGVKDFKCEVCSKCFAEKSTLNQHMKLHTNDRRFKCTFCDKAYVQKPSLTWHMKASHANENANASKEKNSDQAQLADNVEPVPDTEVDAASC